MLLLPLASKTHLTRMHGDGTIRSNGRDARSPCTYRARNLRSLPRKMRQRCIYCISNCSRQIVLVNPLTSGPIQQPSHSCVFTRDVFEEHEGCDECDTPNSGYRRPEILKATFRRMSHRARKRKLRPATIHCHIEHVNEQIDGLPFLVHLLQRLYRQHLSSQTFIFFVQTFMAAFHVCEEAVGVGVTHHSVLCVEREWATTGHHRLDHVPENNATSRNIS